MEATRTGIRTFWLGLLSMGIPLLGLTVGLFGCGLETADVGAMKWGNGKVVDVQLLGRMKTSSEGNMDVIQSWIQEAYDRSEGDRSFECVIAGVTEHIRSSGVSSGNEEMVQLDVFSGTVVDKMGNQVFVFQSPNCS